MSLKPRTMAMIRKGEKIVTRLSKMNLPYSYGGARVAGHITDPIDGLPWTDCSGCASYVLEKMGIKLKDYAGSTWSLAKEGHRGESQYLTLYIKNTAHDEHIIVRGRKRPKPWHLGFPRFRYWQCGGFDNPQHGEPTWFIPGLTMGLRWKKRVREFYIHRQFDNQLGL